VEVALVKPVAAAVREYVPPPVGVPTVPLVLLLFAGIVTLVDVNVAMPGVAEVIPRVTVVALTMVPHDRHPPTLTMTVNESGELVVSRPVCTPENANVGVWTAMSSTPPIHPGALAENWTVPGATPVLSKQATL
jgi:hypothetical protein